MESSNAMTVLLVNLAVTLSLVGLIWFVQIVHYPMFELVGDAEFVRYEKIHQQRTTWVVAPLMLTELITAFLLLSKAPEGVSPLLLWIAAALVLVIWVSTWFWQVPSHESLSQGFQRGQHRFLVQTNWLRTFAWTTRGLFMLVALQQAMPD